MLLAAARALPHCRHALSVTPLVCFSAMAAADCREPAVLGVPADFSSGSALIKFRATPALAADTLVFVGEAAHIQAAAVPGSAVGDFLAGSPVVKGGLVDRAKSASDAPLVSETLVPGEGTALKRVVLVTLPRVAGRHNCAARPHAIRAGLKAAGVSGDVEIVLVLPDASRAQAAALAVPRAIPAYTRKTAVGTGAFATVAFHALDGSVQDAGALARYARLSSSIRMAGALVDQPTNELHTDAFVAVARAVAAEAGGDITVIQGTDLRDAGYGGLWGVGQASVHLPALAILSFVPEGVDPHTPSICFVGKGIVYDTGGLSIKGKTGMPGMKKDMGGAAGILGAWRSLALAGAGSGLNRPLHALLCLAENSVSKEAQRPDDVVTLFSGRTVELNNTDAEGRLVLGDGVAHACKFLKPAFIFDMATLTGAQGIATGRNHSALYCNDDELEAAVVAAGKASGDLAHPMPFAPEFYRKEFASPIADMKNSVADRSNAQPSCAGQFVGNHLGPFLTEGKWCHIDMASPASAAARGTGYGVALLEEVVTALSASAPPAAATGAAAR